MPTVEFFYDVGSPFTYLASTQIEAIAADCDSRVQWRPFLIGGVFKATGNRPPASVHAKMLYLIQDLRRWSEYYGVRLRNPPIPPLNTLLAMRVLTAAETALRPELSHRLFHAYWVEERDLTDEQVLRDLVGEKLVAQASEQEVKDALRATTDEAVARGAFGAPAMFVGDELFWGNDRLPFLEQRLRSLVSPA